ncbi:MAG: biopolymer transporter ExbD [Thermoguttaceae bacterium]|jgi:biopolymer transport protein ExbD
MPLKTHFDEQQPTLNLTAMLDVMFLLIIFFMLGSRFVDEERQIGLHVPEVADRGVLTAGPQTKTVQLYRDGTMTLDGATVTLPELTRRLAAAQNPAHPLGVLLRGDAHVDLQQAAAVLNACKQAGVADLGISVQLAAPEK